MKVWLHNCHSVLWIQHILWNIMKWKTNKFSVISDSLKPLILILSSCQVQDLFDFFLKLSALTKLWFYCRNKHTLTVFVQCSSFSFWYALSLSKLYSLNIFLAKQRCNGSPKKKTKKAVNEDHKWKVAYSSTYNKLLKCGFCTTMEQWSKHRYVRLSTVPPTSKLWLWNLIYLSIAAKPIIIQ